MSEHTQHPHQEPPPLHTPRFEEPLIQDRDTGDEDDAGQRDWRWRDRPVPTHEGYGVHNIRVVEV